MSMVVSVLSAKSYGHVAAHCSSRNLLVREAGDEIETVVYEPFGSAIDFDDDARVFSIQLCVIKCSYIAIRDENWLSCVYSTPILHMRERL